MIETSAPSPVAADESPTADQAESFLDGVRRLQRYWEEGLLSGQELVEATAKLREHDVAVAPVSSEQHR